jgi:hypothetical protein
MEEYDYMLCIQVSPLNIIVGDIYKFRRHPYLCGYDKQYWKELSKVEVLVELGKGAKIHEVR